MEEGSKICKTCGALLPRTAEYFHRHPKTKDGFQPKCKPCAAAYAAQYRSKNGTALREASRKYYAVHKPEVRERQREYYGENRDGIRAQQQERRSLETPAGREQRRLYNLAYRENHAERLRAAQRDHHARNPLAYRMWSQAYKARRRAAPGHHTDADVRRQFKRQAGHCHWCQEPLLAFERDHVVPLSRGGSDSPENIVVVCQSCNRKKGSRALEEWLQIIWK